MHLLQDQPVKLLPVDVKPLNNKKNCLGTNFNAILREKASFHAEPRLLIPKGLKVA